MSVRLLDYRRLPRLPSGDIDALAWLAEALLVEHRRPHDALARFFVVLGR